MKTSRGLFNLWLLSAILLLTVFTAFADAATVSGTVTNNSDKAGRVFLSGQWSSGGDSGWGVSVLVGANGSTNYVIRGVQNGTYTVRAFLDTQNNGMQNANDPVGTSASFNVTAGADSSFNNVTLNNPPSVGLQPPQGVSAVSGDQGVLVIWNSAKDTNGREIAYSYRVYWSASPNPGPLNMTGGGSSPVIPSNDNNAFIKLFSNGTVLYFAVTATLNGVESAPVNANSGAQVVIGPSPGGVTVSGTVSVTGATLGATPLFIALGGGDGPPSYIAAIASPSNGQAFSISGVLPGNYGVYAIIDMNNNGIIDLGDISNTNGNGVPVTVANTNVTNANVSIVASNVQFSVRTNHWKQYANESYGLNFEVTSQVKRPVNVAVTGPQLATPIDMGLSNWGAFEAWPSVASRPILAPSPDTYSFTIFYSDGTNTGGTPLTAPITGIVDSFATPISPVGFVPYPFTPTDFYWSAPASPPTPYIYSFWLNVPGFSDAGFYVLSNSTTKVSYPSYTGYVDGYSYTWQISVVDIFGNRAQNWVNFTPTTSPVITGFSPASGVPGTRVTITGLNFDGTAPANNQVFFPGTGVAAPVVSATATQLVVTIPAVATSANGSIGITVASKSGQSSSPFNILSTISMSGTISDSVGILPGATVELPGNSLVSTTSAADGTYTLAGLPSNQAFSVKVSSPGYATEYTKNIITTANLTGSNFRLFSAAELTGWGVIAGNGVIRGQVRNSANATAIAGATVTITASPRSYTILYANVTTLAPEAGSATTANGIFYILNLTPGDSVTVQAAATGFGSASATYTAYADAVAVGGIGLTDNTRPIISAFAMTTPYNSLTVPIPSFIATDNAAVTGYLVTESLSTPSLGGPNWSASPPATFTFFSAGSHTAYGWARDATGNISIGSILTVIIDLTTPTTTASPLGGTRAGPVNVYLTVNEPATIYYTTNGASPTTSSTSFIDNVGNSAKGPIVIAANTILQFFARDLAGNDEIPHSENYFYGTPTTLTIGVDSSAIVYGGSITATATVSPAVNSGTVSFYIDGILMGAMPISGTTAQLLLSNIQVAGSPHQVTASYSGNDTYAASTTLTPATVTANKVTVTLAVSGTTQTYDGTPKPVTVTVSDPTVSGVLITYDGSTSVPTNAGSYAVVASLNNSNYLAANVSGTLVINKATAILSLSGLIQTYTGSPVKATVTTIPTGLSGVIVTYDSSLTAPINVGNYAVVASLPNANYTAANATGNLIVAKATAAVSLGSLSQTYTGTARVVTATTNPAGLTVNLTYDGSATVPTNVGSYAVVGTISDINYQGTASGTLVVGKATATVTITNLTQTDNGTARVVTTTTNPAGLTVNVTYNSSSSAPISAGSYAVVATIVDANYQGSASSTLTVLAYGDIAGGADGGSDGVVDIEDAYNYLLLSLHLAPQPAYTDNLLLAPVIGGTSTAVQGSRQVNGLDVGAILARVVGLW